MREETFLTLIPRSGMKGNGRNSILKYLRKYFSTVTMMILNIKMLSSRLRVLATERRLQILGHLKCHRHGTMSAIAKAIRLSPQATSQHLRILAAAGIVRRKKRGLYVTYRLVLHQEPPLQQILKLL